MKTIVTVDEMRGQAEATALKLCTAMFKIIPMTTTLQEIVLNNVAIAYVLGARDALKSLSNLQPEGGETDVQNQGSIGDSPQA